MSNYSVVTVPKDSSEEGSSAEHFGAVYSKTVSDTFLTPSPTFVTPRDTKVNFRNPRTYESWRPEGVKKVPETVFEYTAPKCSAIRTPPELSLGTCPSVGMKVIAELLRCGFRLTRFKCNV